MSLNDSRKMVQYEEIIFFTKMGLKLCLRFSETLGLDAITIIYHVESSKSYHWIQRYVIIVFRVQVVP
jgi:hypothetical protein